MSFNLPNPSLLGILLIISTHSGPQLVFNYPTNLSGEANDGQVTSDEEDEDEEGHDADPEQTLTHNQNLPKVSEALSPNPSLAPKLKSTVITKFKSSEWDSHHLDFYMGTKKDLLLFLDEQELTRKNYQSEKNYTTDADEESTSKSTSKNKSIFGVEPTYLCEMLSPPKNMCNSRFEIMVDNKIFLGLPIHKYANGNWRLRKGDRETTVRSKKDSSSREKPERIDSDSNNEEPFKSSNGIDLKGTGKAGSTSINMFHLVFIMNPPVIESTYRVDEMFHYVISRLSLVLRYEQLKYDYISLQVKLIINLKEQYTEEYGLTQHLISKSSLCKLICDCYNSISQSKIANLSVNNKLRSFQIPIKTEFHSLPEVSVPFIPGSHLSSTVNLLENSGLISVGETTRYSQSSQIDPSYLSTLDQEDGTNSSDDVIFFALLLLDDPESIIRDIKTEQDSTLARFIRMIKPTESLLKLTLRNTSLDRMQIKSFAFHLIYWRRARVIQPLSTRSTYIISPMSPITINLFNDIKRFKKAHPAIPSLPNFLKLLSPKSRKPQQFASVIPSKDHRDIYLEALGWLIRYGYVTQLQTFIWLKISRNVKIKVDEDLENENATKKRSSVSKKAAVGGTDNTSKDVKRPILPPQDHEVAKKNVDDEIDKMKEILKAVNSGHNVSVEEDDDTIILDPGRATALERRWINKIIFEECKLSSELIAIFYKLLKYMNGKSPLELLLLKENVSRGDLRKLLFAIEDHIISVRHW
ncbi:nitrogen permease regulator 3 [Suhomyces tanzawaensis NRRL Y-17324]|uniref:Nitrogen permease regulator 3 n=1 Tax=Suhomyces tanzawaensis NRRL Y-17324 TaxID=984487 RepID=A0A1E4SP46_9ASCO|nr:nitrogen permease regulator 3 [Suhomyces tanzawaensis NRRL Y-17324]ODV81187.1 nitrogen permease regulator 3 [Suhomyces tanzawaensis NRRL Y-17324]